MSGFALDMPADFVEAVAVRVAEILAARESPLWMTRAQAAVYLAVPPSRLEKDKTIPCHRWDGRVLYNRDELDAYMLSKGGLT